MVRGVSLGSKGGDHMSLVRLFFRDISSLTVARWIREGIPRVTFPLSF